MLLDTDTCSTSNRKIEETLKPSADFIVLMISMAD